MKVSPKKAAENRAALVDAAQRLLRERGFAGAGVAEIGRKAGLTQGAIYGQFGSKDELAAEAVRQAFADGAAAWAALEASHAEPFLAFLDSYLSELHLNDVGSGCVLAACLSEVRRQEGVVGIAFAEGVSAMVDQVQRCLPETDVPEDARKRALAVLAALVGGVALARSVASANSDLARDIVAATRAELERVARGCTDSPA